MICIAQIWSHHKWTCKQNFSKSRNLFTSWDSWCVWHNLKLPALKERSKKSVRHNSPKERLWVFRGTFGSWCCGVSSASQKFTHVIDVWIYWCLCTAEEKVKDVILAKMQNLNITFSTIDLINLAAIRYQPPWPYCQVTESMKSLFTLLGLQ